MNKQEQKRQVKLIVMIVMVVGYMFAELFVGLICGSLTLVGDALHMTSDAINLFIGLFSIKLALKKADNNMTFGYKRAEILSAFFSASFLMSTAFFLLTETINKFMSPQDIEGVDTVLWTSIGGIIVNIIGIFMFHGNCEEGHQCPIHSPEIPACECQEAVLKEHKKHKHKHEHEHEHKENKHKDLAMRGIFLHILGDFMGSVVAIAAACVYKFADKWKYKVYVDPSCSLIMVFFLFQTSIPLFKQTASILMMKSTSVDKVLVQKQLQQIKGIYNIQDLHMWTYVPGHEVCHVIVTIRKNKSNKINTSQYESIQQKVENLLKNKFGFHQTIVQVNVVCSQKECQGVVVDLKNKQKNREAEESSCLHHENM